MPYADPEKRRASVRAWQHKRRNEMRAIIRQAKAIPCADCQQSYPHYVMQFDHIRGLKVEGIAKMVQQPSAHKVRALIEEMSKCEVVCANCHALRHGGTGSTRE